jgi:hypothetical protein
MKGLSMKSILGLAVALAFAVSPSFAFGFGFHKSDQRSTRVTVASPMELSNGAKLAPGKYQMKVPDNTQLPEVAFYQYGKVIAKSRAKVVSQTQKNPYTEIDSVTKGKYQLVTKIRPAGWHEILVFKNKQSTANG